MNEYIYSVSKNAFFPLALKDNYLFAGSWPDDGVEVDNSIFQKFTSEPPIGKIRAPGISGLPSWINIPPLTLDELIEKAESKRANLITQANDFINSKQWPSKLALGRLRDADKIEFNRYLDYIDALEAIDTSTAPDITFPVL